LISYYTKGALVALALDLAIRRDTRGARSLDDVMRALWARYGTSATGVPEDGFETLASEVSGLDLQAFFDTAVRSTEDPPYAELLATVGVRFDLRAASATSPGGRDVYVPAAGLRLREQGGAVAVAHVLDGAPAQIAGLAGGDELLAVDGLKVLSAARLVETLSPARAGELISMHVFRRDELHVFELTLCEPPADTCRLSWQDDASPAALAARAAWLGPQAHA
jgi:predicted metalloprotease with PDZ domain